MNGLTHCTENLQKWYGLYDTNDLAKFHFKSYGYFGIRVPYKKQAIFEIETTRNYKKILVKACGGKKIENGP